MKILASHQFKNDKELRVLFLNSTDQRKLGVPQCDTLALSTIDDETEHRAYMRPDEALIIIQLLSKAIYESVKGYEIGLKRTHKNS